MRSQAVLQGVAFMGVQVLRSKRLILLHEKKGSENRKNEVELCPPSVPPPEALYDVVRNPDLPFLAFFGKPPENQGFFIPSEPLKCLGKKGKTKKKKKQGIP